MRFDDINIKNTYNKQLLRLILNQTRINRRCISVYCKVQNMFLLERLEMIMVNNPKINE